MSSCSLQKSLHSLGAVAQINRDLLTRLGLRLCEGRLTLVNPRLLLDMAEDDPAYALAIIVAAQHSPPLCLDHFSRFRLSALVIRCLDMHFDEAELLAWLGDQSIMVYQRTAENFYSILTETIDLQRLQLLFCHRENAEYHRRIVPSAYNELTGEVYPAEMALWRANFRGMAPERQMIAATIIWLYQSGQDSTWLRRVPCTWSAPEALHYLKDTGCLPQWLRLLAAYPGW